MAKYKVVVGTAFIAGQKYRRGDVVEVANPELHGTTIEPVVEVEKPKPARKPRAKKAAE